MRANVRAVSVVLARLGTQAQDIRKKAAQKPSERVGARRRTMVSLERLLANERTEDLRREAGVWQLERRLRRSPERRGVARRVVAFLGRGSARGEAAVGSSNETKVQLG